MYRRAQSSCNPDTMAAAILRKLLMKKNAFPYMAYFGAENTGGLAKDVGIDVGEFGLARS